jgi:hypothetical protein
MWDGDFRYGREQPPSRQRRRLRERRRAAPVAAGIRIAASDVSAGDADGGPGAANIIGNAQTAIEVGLEGGPEVAGVIVAGNIVGKAPTGGGGAPVGTGILIRPAAASTQVLGNTITNTVAGGVVVAPDANGVSSVHNRISGNRFEAIGALSIDLGGNSVSEPNDPGDTDLGPNDLLNHPIITRAVSPGRVRAGCRVDFYLAHPFPGGADDFGATPPQGACSPLGHQVPSS